MKAMKGRFAVEQLALFIMAALLLLVIGKLILGHNAQSFEAAQSCTNPVNRLFADRLGVSC